MLQVWGGELHHGTLSFCMATNHRCKYCKLTGHLEKCCNKKFPQRHKEMMQQLKNRDYAKSVKRVNYIEESEEEEEEKESCDEEQLILRVDENGCKPFYMEGTMCGNYFKAIIDTGSPVSIFTKKDLLKIVGERKTWRKTWPDTGTTFGPTGDNQGPCRA